MTKLAVLLDGGNTRSDFYGLPGLAIPGTGLAILAWTKSGSAIIFGVNPWNDL
jgi:hypothetical protein